MVGRKKSVKITYFHTCESKKSNSPKSCHVKKKKKFKNKKRSKREFWGKIKTGRNATLKSRTRE